MKRLFVLASAVFIALSSVAQDEDTDEYYFFDSDSVVGDLATYSEKTMDVAFEAPSTIISTPGVWYSFSFVTKDDKNMMRVDKLKYQFKAGGTGSMTKSGNIDVNYQNIKNIDVQLVTTLSWQKTRDVFTMNVHIDKASMKCTDQSQLNKMSAREKYDFDEKIKLAVNLVNRAYGGISGSVIMLRLDKDIMIAKSGNTTSGFVSQAGLNKLIKARTDLKKRREDEKARREAELKARREAEEKARLEDARLEADENSKPEVERIAKFKANGGKVYEVNGVKFTMVAVEGGTFKMGSESGDSDEKPIHEVTLNGFAIGQTEVTQDLWTAVMGNNPSEFKGAKLPVENVSWNECQTFIQKLNQLTGQQFRLPTEAEWEYAARGGNQSKGYKYSGSDNISEVAWFINNSDVKTHVVAVKAPNELGIYDMSGNVSEWCQDWYGDYSTEPVSNPTGPDSGEKRVYRGGSYSHSDFIITVAYRFCWKPETVLYSLGFRLAQ